MRILPRFALMILVILTLPAVPVYSAVSKDLMPVSEVKRDMTGYGLTVFQGTRIEQFRFRVLGVLRKSNTGRDLILIRASGGPISSRGAGIIAGMSGSPCYIKGRLVGAVGFSIQFSKEPIGMITPIQDMLDAWDSNLPTTPPGVLSAPLVSPVSIGGKTYTRLRVVDQSDIDRITDNGSLTIKRLMTPIMVSGMSDKGIEQLEKALRPLGMLAMAGPGGASIGGKLPVFKPGAAVGVALATGDVEMSSIGTLTYRKGNRILAFGHPMMGIGPIDAPLTGAYIHDVIASYRSSTKLGSTMSTIGALTQDRPWSVGGLIGKKSNTVPLTVAINNTASNRQKTIRVQVLNHPLMTSQIIASIVTDCIYQMQPNPGDITATVSYRIMTDKLGKIERSDTYFDEDAIDEASTKDISNVMTLLSMNKYEPVNLRSVKVDVKLELKHPVASIDRIYVDKDEYKPGELVNAGVVLRPYQRDRITKTVSIKIPDNASDGQASLIIRGGGVSEIITQAPVPGAIAPVTVGPDELTNSDNAGQLIDRYLKRDKNNQIIAKLILKSSSLTINDRSLEGLPTVTRDLMISTRSSGARSVRDEVKTATESNYIITGAAVLNINIKRQTTEEAKPATSLAIGIPIANANISGDSLYDTYSYASADMIETAVKDKAKPAPKDKGTADSAKSKQPEVKTDISTEKPKAENPPAPAATPTPAVEAKPIVRQVNKWLVNKAVDMAKGKFDGCAVDTQDKLIMVPKIRRLLELPEQFVWSMAAVQGGVIAGTGSAGRIYRIEDSGKYRMIFDTKEVAVHSLAVDSQGAIYAGTSPSGKVFKINPDGNGSLFCTLPAKHILALALSGDGNLYAGAGDSGNIFRITPEGKYQIFCKLPEQSIFCLKMDKDGSILAGTGSNGVLFRINQNGNAIPLYDSEAAAVTSTAIDGAGKTYAGISPKGDVYRMDTNGVTEIAVSKASNVTSMLSDKYGRIIMTNGSGIQITWPTGFPAQIDAGTDKVQFISLANQPDSDTLYAGTANPAIIYTGSLWPGQASYESPVYDTKSNSTWSSVKWSAGSADTATMETRTGNTATPDDNWSAWSVPYTNSDSSHISSPNARYIQYRLEMKTAQLSAPAVSSVEISYLTANQPPQVKLTSPVFGDSWSGSKTVKWTGADPDKDTLRYELSCSSDMGKTWNILVGPGKESNGAKLATVDETKVFAKVKSELEKSPDIPADMKKTIIEKTTAMEVKPKDESVSQMATSYTWDTKKTVDGIYILKLNASDSPSNAAGALSVEVLSDKFTICNTPPVIKMATDTLTATAGTPVSLAGRCSSNASTITAVQYNINGKDWCAAAADDGIFDNNRENFTINLAVLQNGKYKVEVQAIDAAGNSSKSVCDVTVQ